MRRLYLWYDGTLDERIPNHASSNSIYVLHVEAQSEIDKRDEQIADLKALLVRSADMMQTAMDGYYADGPDGVNALVAEIEKALA